MTNVVNRKGEFYRKELTVANTSTSVWQSVTNAASGETTVIGNIFVPKTPEAFTYDDDGNLTSDGHWTNRWDAENRLIEVEALSSVPDGAKKKLVFGYDWQGRRISKTVSNWVSSAWALSETKRFAYDGWNLMAVLNGTNLLQSFVWGTDLSGTMQGAGGVGGLIAFNDTTNVHFVAFDGNGNVTRLVKGSDGTTSGNYEYGAFGEPMRVTGTASKLNPFRFSTKYADDESDLLYYGYRYYNQSAGRWLSRDPIEERGGVNLYGFVRNDSVDRFDKLGLAAWVWNSPSTTDYSISYDPSMTIRRHGAPTSYIYGTTAAELEAYRRGGLNNTLFQHYLNGAGAAFDLTSDATIRSEVIGALTPKMNTAENDLRKKVEAFKCPGTPNLFGNSISVYADASFTPIDHTGFTSSIWVIKTADSGLSKKCAAIVICLCNGERYALITCDFHMYFYDQFADAANLRHKPGVVTEWKGGTQFDETGAWGRIFFQIGTYR